MGSASNHAGNMEPLNDGIERVAERVVVSSPGPLSATEKNRLFKFSFESNLQNTSVSSLTLPWETPQMRMIFGEAAGKLLPNVDPLCHDVLAMNRPVKGVPPRVPKPPSRHQRVIRFRFRSRDLNNTEQIELLYEKWYLVLMHAPSASEIGRAIRGKPRTEIFQNLGEAFGGKSISTLRKRQSQVAHFLAWAMNCDPPRRVFPIAATDVREYLYYLKDCGKGHSVICGVSEFARFLQYVLGVEVESDALQSVRIRGIIKQVMQTRPKRRQSRQPTVAELRFLESFLDNATNDLTDRYAAGTFLFIAYSRARVGDVKCRLTARYTRWPYNWIH